MRYVKYVGLAHQRIITPSDWASIGIVGETAHWGAHNAHTIPLEVFTEEQVRRAIEPDANFVIVGLDDRPTPLTHEMVPAQADGPRVDINGAVGNASTGDSHASMAAPTSVSTGTGSGHDD